MNNIKCIRVKKKNKIKTLDIKIGENNLIKKQNIANAVRRLKFPIFKWKKRRYRY